MRWLLDHKADFEILCKNKNMDMDIDWDSPRVICIAESYNKFDIDTADVLPIDMELLHYRIYDKNILLVEPEHNEKIKTSTSNIVKKEKEKELQKTYSIEYHLSNTNQENINLFQALREIFLSIDKNIIEEVKKIYIAYKTSTNFTVIIIQKYDLRIFLYVKSGQLHDPQNFARDLAKPKRIGNAGNADYDLKLKNETEIDGVFALIKQSYDLNI